MSVYYPYFTPVDTLGQTPANLPANVENTETKEAKKLNLTTPLLVVALAVVYFSI